MIIDLFYVYLNYGSLIVINIGVYLNDLIIKWLVYGLLVKKGYCS